MTYPRVSKYDDGHVVTCLYMRTKVAHLEFGGLDVHKFGVYNIRIEALRLLQLTELR